MLRQLALHECAPAHRQSKLCGAECVEWMNTSEIYGNLLAMTAIQHIVGKMAVRESMLQEHILAERGGLSG